LDSGSVLCGSVCGCPETSKTGGHETLCKNQVEHGGLTGHARCRQPGPRRAGRPALPRTRRSCVSLLRVGGPVPRFRSVSGKRARCTGHHWTLRGCGLASAYCVEHEGFERKSPLSRSLSSIHIDFSQPLARRMAILAAYLLPPLKKLQSSTDRR
jgi:hypothetical protein